MNIKFKRQELRDYLVAERVFGDAVAYAVDLDFLKDPKSNPDLVVECYRVALEKLGYKVENLHQQPSSVALDGDPATYELFDEGYWIRRNVRSRISHLFNRYQTAIKPAVTLADVLAPTASRFASIMSNMLNIHFHRQSMLECLAQVDEQVEDKRRHTRQQQAELDNLKGSVEANRGAHERNLAEAVHLKSEIGSNEKAINEIMIRVNSLKELSQTKEEENEQAERRARAAQSEVAMLKTEKSRLTELVVTDPGEWERAFYARQNDIEECKQTIGHLKMERIPTLDENVKKAQFFEKEITKVNERMEELKLKRVEHARILGDLSNVESQISDRSTAIQGMKREADFTAKSRGIHIKQMESQEDALYDAKDQHQQRNAEFLDIKKGLSKGLKEINHEQAELARQKHVYERKTPTMQDDHDKFTGELEEVNEQCAALHYRVLQSWLKTLPE